MPEPGAHYKGIEMPKIQGGRFNMAKPMTDLDWQIKRSKEIPGPGVRYRCQVCCVARNLAAQPPRSLPSLACLGDALTPPPRSQTYYTDLSHHGKGPVFRERLERNKRRQKLANQAGRGAASTAPDGQICRPATTPTPISTLANGLGVGRHRPAARYGRQPHRTFAC